MSLVNDGKIVVPLGNGFNLVAVKSEDEPYEKEIYIGIVQGDINWWQDLAVIRPSYSVIGDDVVWRDDNYDVIVYTDEGSEDYTHKFSVKLYDEKEYPEEC